MKLRFFDFEVFPHWWCCVFGDMINDTVDSNIKDNMIVVRSDMSNARDELVKMLKEEDVCVFGYNIKHYDLIIANAIYQGFTPEQIKIVNDIIIDPSKAYISSEHARLSPFAKRKFNTMYEDMMDDNSGSLKELEANLGLNILESSVPFDKEDLTIEDIDEVIKYCKQDVYATMKYYEKIVVYYSRNKLAICKAFNLDMKSTYASTNANLVGMALGAIKSSFNDEDKIQIDLPTKIKEYCYENLPHDIITKICNSTESFDTQLFNNTVTFGNGGIHSTINGYDPENEALYIESDDDWVLVNVDGKSYYPSIMIQFKLLSRSIKDPAGFARIFNRRMEIKAKEHPTKEDKEFDMAAKLVLNTTFGASGNKYLSLYDPYMCTSVCRVGQIFLGAFANKVHKVIPNLQVIQTNTDGVLLYINRKYLDKLQECINEWQNVSGIIMEIEFVERIWQKNVNNYILIERDKNGDEEIKSRGQWLKTSNHRVGGVKVTPLTAFICAESAQEYLLHGKDIISNIVNCKDLQKFAISCTKGPTYSGVIHKRVIDNTSIEIPLTRANRVYATKDTSYGKLFKLKKYKGNISYTQMPNTPDNCKTINEDLSTYDFNDIKKDLNYMYYVSRTYDLLNVVWKQLLGTSIQRINKFDLDWS